MTDSVVNNNVIPSTPQVVYPQQCVTQPQCTTNAIPSSNGVNIVIYNPSVTPNANVSNIHNYPQTYPQNYYTMQTPPQKKETETPLAAAQLDKKADEKAEKQPTKQKEVVLLTDEYIKTLESYLDSQDPKVRTLGVKELLNRFKEDETRKSDIGLTALLNKALQDPKDAIRFTAMAILNSGYATGDELTNKILTNIQAGNSGYGDDSLVASEVKLKNAGKKVYIPDTDHQPVKKEEKTK